MKDFEARLKGAVAAMEGLDPTLSQELRAVRERSRDAAANLGPQLESLGVSPGSDQGGLAIETLVHRTGRPVLAVVNDEAQLTFRDAESEVWRGRLTAARELLGRAIRAVGRIEVENHDLAWLGTGWLVAPDVVVTNRHVANEFTARGADGFVFRQGVRGPMSARIDFLEEMGRDAAREFQVSKILHVEDEPGPDVAFLRVEQSSGAALAAPIDLARDAAVPRQQVAVIGYPARDGRIPEQDLMFRIFGDVFDKKRLAPGLVQRLEGGLVLHDCSTLGGNSGSVVLDLASGSAVALHFSGRFLESNFGVPAPVLGEVLRGMGRAPARAAGPARRPRVELQGAGPAGGSSVDLTIPVRIRIEVGAPAPGSAPQGRPPALARSGGEPVAGAGATAPADVVAEGRAEDYADRKGYDPDFLGFPVPLPAILDDGDVLRFRFDGRKEQELRYQHFSVVMSRSRRLCRLSAVNIDGSKSRRVKRPAWRIDPRIRPDQQIRGECYGNEPMFARGHMTRREDPVWGAPSAAARGNSDSMHVTNVVPQMQPFNAGIWLGLENYALEHAREDDMKISVFTGPVLTGDDPVRYGVPIPTSFWKVIAFVHEEARAPCVTAYTMSQEQFLREEEFVFGRHETSQVPLAAVEAAAGIAFADELRRLDPLERVAEARARPLRDFSEIRFR